MDPRKRIRVLCIEDDPDTRLLIRTILNARHIAEVEMAPDCATARGVLGETVFDLVTLDIQLPDGDGLEFLDEITGMSDPPPTIIVTAHGDEASAARALVSGAAGYVIKGHHMSERLTDAVDKALSDAELARVNAALSESEELYRTVVETSPDAILVADVKANIVKASSRALEMFITDSAADIEGRSAFEFFAPEERDRAGGNFARRFERNDLGYVEYTFLRRDGSRFAGELNVSVLRDTGGAPTGVVAVLRDITERRSMQDELRVDRALLDAANRILQETLTCETVEDVAKMCLAVVEELTGSKFGFIGEVNEEGSFDTIAISNPGWEECLMPRTRAVKLLRNMRIRGIWAQPLLCEQGVIINEPMAHAASVGVPEGHPEVTAYLGIPLWWGGRAFGTIGLANKEGGYEQADLEALETLSVPFVEALIRKRADEQIREANRELEFYSHAVAHELRGPISTISAAAMIIEDLFEQADPERFRLELRNLTSILANSSARADLMITDLLEMARAQQAPQEVTSVNVHTVVSRVVADRADDIEVRGIEVRLGDDLGTVVANPTHLYSIFSNLVGNAVKYNDSERPALEVIRLGPEVEGVHRFRVKDNGSGAALEGLSDPFSPFAAGEAGGVGLGLAIVDRLVRLYDGEIGISVNDGVCFDFTVSDRVT
ncbi:MAG: PAS domain S-box protein [Actinomycetota bacterium]